MNRLISVVLRRSKPFCLRGQRINTPLSTVVWQGHRRGGRPGRRFVSGASACSEECMGRFEGILDLTEDLSGELGSMVKGLVLVDKDPNVSSPTSQPPCRSAVPGTDPTR